MNSYEEVRQMETVTVSGQVIGVRAHINTAFYEVGLPGESSRQVLVRRAEDGDGEVKWPPDIGYGDIIQATGPLDETDVSRRNGRNQLTVFSSQADVLILAKNQKFRWPDASIREQHAKQAEYLSMLTARAASRTTIRRMLDMQDYTEIETSMLQPVASGAAARTFQTEANFDGENYHLRIAPEIDLKVVMALSGLRRVYEIGRSWRNEGISPVHHPEFTSLELYTAYMEQEAAVDITQELLIKLAEAYGHADKLELGTMPVRDYADLFAEADASLDLRQLLALDKEEQKDALRQYLRNNSIHNPEVTDLGVAGTLDWLFKRMIRPHIQEPTIVRGYLSQQMPLAETLPDQPGIVNGFQILVAGSEVGKAYQELVDADKLEQNLAAQSDEAKDDAVATDTRLVDACRMGLPPTYGIGIGLDRLHAILAGRRIEQVIPIPIR